MPTINQNGRPEQEDTKMTRQPNFYQSAEPQLAAHRSSRSVNRSELYDDPCHGELDAETFQGHAEKTENE